MNNTINIEEIAMLDQDLTPALETLSRIDEALNAIKEKSGNVSHTTHAIAETVRKMGNDSIYVPVDNRRIHSAPLDGLIVKGDHNAVSITFGLSRIVNGIDIAKDDTVYEMCGRNINSQTVTERIDKGAYSNPDFFTLKWTIGRDFTAVGSCLDIWIRATRYESGKIVMCWQTVPSRVFVANCGATIHAPDGTPQACVEH